MPKARKRTIKRLEAKVKQAAEACVRKLALYSAQGLQYKDWRLFTHVRNRQQKLTRKLERLTKVPAKRIRTLHMKSRAMSVARTLTKQLKVLEANGLNSNTEAFRAQQNTGSPTGRLSYHKPPPSFLSANFGPKSQVIIDLEANGLRPDAKIDWEALKISDALKEEIIREQQRPEEPTFNLFASAPKTFESSDAANFNSSQNDTFKGTGVFFDLGEIDDE